MWYMPNTIRLIENYQNHPELWDPDHPNFKDRECKKNSLKNLADEFGVDVLEIERKLKGLKTQFAREFMKQSTGHRSTWFGFELLQFLLRAKKCHTNGNDVSNIANEDLQISSALNNAKIPQLLHVTVENETESNSFEENSSFISDDINITEPETSMSFVKKEFVGPAYPCGFSSYPKRQREYSSDEEIRNKFRRKNLVLSNRELELNSERDKFRVFGEYVANKLRNINDSHARSVAEYYISNILFQAEMTNYQINLKFTPPTDFQLFHSNEKE